MEDNGDLWAGLRREVRQVLNVRNYLYITAGGCNAVSYECVIVWTHILQNVTQQVF